MVTGSEDSEPQMTMTGKTRYRFGPTRGELWFWLCISLGGFCLVALAIGMHGIPGRAALVEVVGLPVLLFGYLGGRSVKRLIRRQHPQ